MDNTNHMVEEAVALAGKWQKRANELVTSDEKVRQRQLAALLANPMDRILLTKMIDQSFRPRSNRRIADQIHYLLAEYGIPRFFTTYETFLMLLFLKLGRHLPDLTVPQVIAKMRQDSRHAIISGEPEALKDYLERRRAEGVRVNINHLGEAVLGETEAKARLEAYKQDLRNPAIEYISVKISTIFSQIRPLAFDRTVSILKERLAELYRTAAGQRFHLGDGSRVPKFVNLDMENYSDLAITVAAFTQTLEQAEFQRFYAGMALQAYLPDSYQMLQELTAWARKRVAAGGSPVKVRIVKGANLEMERVESALFDWPLAPYNNKLDVDANYKRMIDFGMQPDNIKALRLGIASHNLFDLAYAYLTGRENNVADLFSFEMLEGMADHIRRTIQETGQEIVLYAPVATEAEFINAIAYLIRRLDENTGTKNFLRHVNDGLNTASQTWQMLQDHFKESVKRRATAAQSPHRIQNRLTESFTTQTGTCFNEAFANEPNTDWSLAPNRQWAETIRDKWKKDAADQPMKIPLVIAGEEIYDNREIRESIDPNQLPQNVVVARHAMGSKEDIEAVVAAAKADPDGWRQTSLDERHLILSKVAVELRKARGDLIGAAAADTGKVFTESDVEVSEAIDFAEYYPFSLKPFTEIETINCHGKGVGVVISPWNFPIAIPCGGISASLAAGNTVVFKPSSDAVLTAWVLCQCFWRAGVSKKILQFLPCSGTLTGKSLTAHSAVDYVILTGGTETGLKILHRRPEIFLAAETGGKNAMIVTAMADRDQAVKDVVYSAFGNSGQKCSATSLLMLEDEVYEDAGLKNQLIDAARSFKAGSAWDFENQMGPLIKPPGGKLKTALSELEAEESWALKSENKANNPRLWTPGIKWNVRPASTAHLTEFFGPVLGVMRFRDLAHAVALVNQTGYGLTSGLQSLDRREQERWKEGIKAGNLYINRGTTGAVTLRQPFGGMGKSALGMGMKAGGPKYAAQFMNYEETGSPQVDAATQSHRLLQMVQNWRRNTEFAADLNHTIQAIKSYLYHIDHEFSREIDYFRLRGQDNILRHLPVGVVAVRLHAEDSLFEVLARIAAAKLTGNKLRLSLPSDLDNAVIRFIRAPERKGFIGDAPVEVASDRDLIQNLPEIDRVRYAAPNRVPVGVYTAAAEIGFYIARAPVMMEGRIELLQYYRQQSICDNFHRYGNLGERSILD